MWRGLSISKSSSVISGNSDMSHPSTGRKIGVDQASMSKGSTYQSCSFPLELTEHKCFDPFLH